jgi:hypothetical protein
LRRHPLKGAASAVWQSRFRDAMDNPLSTTTEGIST